MPKFFNPNNVSSEVARDYEMLVEAFHALGTRRRSFEQWLDKAVAYAPELLDESNETGMFLKQAYDALLNGEKSLEINIAQYEKIYGKYCRTTLNNRKRFERRLTYGQSVS